MSVPPLVLPTRVLNGKIHESTSGTWLKGLSTLLKPVLDGRIPGFKPREWTKEQSPGNGRKFSPVNPGAYLTPGVWNWSKTPQVHLLETWNFRSLLHRFQSQFFKLGKNSREPKSPGNLPKEPKFPGKWTQGPKSPGKLTTRDPSPGELTPIKFLLG